MGWCFGTSYSNNVQEAFKDHFIPRKFYKDWETKELIESEIIKLEFNGNNAFILEKVGNEYYATSYMLSFSKSKCEFGYKDMGFFGSCNSNLASKTMIELIKKYFNSSTPYFDETIKSWENYQKQKKEKREKLKNLKIGDVVIFPKCNYGGFGNDYKWTVTSIVNDKVYFNGCHLRNWKSQYFEIVA